MNNTNTSNIVMNEGTPSVAERPAVMRFDVFNFGDAEVRTVTKDGEAWFVAKDICEVLGIANSRDATAKLDEDERDDVGITDAIGRKQKTTVVSEPGLYKLIFTSNKPEAKSFKRWVTHDVLPALRKQGFYSMLTDEKLLEVAFDRCLHNEEHQTLEFQLFRMQDELTLKRWEAMENVIWPKRFDYVYREDCDREIEDLWGADVEGAMAAKELYVKNTCSRYGMSRIYGKWKWPKNPFAHRDRKANLEKVIRFEIQSAKARACMGLPEHDYRKLLGEKLDLEEKIEDIKKIIARTDSFLLRHNTWTEPAQNLEEEHKREQMTNCTYMVGHGQLKKFLEM